MSETLEISLPTGINLKIRCESGNRYRSEHNQFLIGQETSSFQNGSALQLFQQGLQTSTR